MSPKKRKYFIWNETRMNLALESVTKQKTGLNEASRIYGVPKATLKRRLDGVNQSLFACRKCMSIVCLSSYAII